MPTADDTDQAQIDAELALLKAITAHAGSLPQAPHVLELAKSYAYISGRARAND